MTVIPLWISLRGGATLSRLEETIWPDYSPQVGIATGTGSQDGHHFRGMGVIRQLDAEQSNFRLARVIRAERPFETREEPNSLPGGALQDGRRSCALRPGKLSPGG